MCRKRFSITALLALGLMLAIGFTGHAKSSFYRLIRIHDSGNAELAKSSGKLAVTKPFTIETWFCFEDVTKDTNGKFLCGPEPIVLACDENWKGMNADVPVERACGWALRTGALVDKNRRSLEFVIGTMGNPKDPEWTVVKTEPLPFTKSTKNPKGWHHVAVCRSMDALKIYLDGTLVGEESCKGKTFVPSPTNVFLGSSRYTPSDRRCHAEFCGFRISSKARYGKSFYPSMDLRADATTVVAVDFMNRDRGIKRSGNARWEVELIGQKPPAPGSQQELRKKIEELERTARGEPDPPGAIPPNPLAKPRKNDGMTFEGVVVSVDTDTITVLPKERKTKTGIVVVEAIEQELEVTKSTLIQAEPIGKPPQMAAFKDLKKGQRVHVTQSDGSTTRIVILDAKIAGTFVAKKLEEPSIAQLTGKWKVTYTNTAVRVYRFDPDGKVTLDKGKIHGQIKSHGDEMLLTLADEDKVERLSLGTDGRLFVEHFDPRSAYPAGNPSVIGIGLRQK